MTLLRAKRLQPTYPTPLSTLQADRTCPNRIAIGTLNWVLQRSQPSLLPVAAATPDLLRQLARLVAQPSLLGPPIASIRNTVSRAAACRLAIGIANGRSLGTQ